MTSGNVRFVRVRGRIIPIRSDGGGKGSGKGRTGAGKSVRAKTAAPKAAAPIPVAAPVRPKQGFEFLNRFSTAQVAKVGAYTGAGLSTVRSVGSMATVKMLYGSEGKLDMGSFGGRIAGVGISAAFGAGMGATSAVSAHALLRNRDTRKMSRTEKLAIGATGAAYGTMLGGQLLFGSKYMLDVNKGMNEKLSESIRKTAMKRMGGLAPVGTKITTEGVGAYDGSFNFLSKEIRAPSNTSYGKNVLLHEAGHARDIAQMSKFRRGVMMGAGANPLVNLYDEGAADFQAYKHLKNTSKAGKKAANSYLKWRTTTFGTYGSSAFATSIMSGTGLGILASQRKRRREEDEKGKK